MKSKLVAICHFLGVYRVSRKIYYNSIAMIWRLREIVTRRKSRLVSRFQREGKDLKLHIGAGLNTLGGWINTDIYANRQNLYLDLKNPFTFSDDLFDFVYSEHVFEHFSYEECRFMLSECLRVMKNDGVLRIATPDLKFLIRLYEETDSTFINDYIDWNATNFLHSRAPKNSVSVINNYVRDWGHQFIYDFETLKFLLLDVGFVDVVECKILNSDHDTLESLEHVDRHPDGFLELESLIVECKKDVSKSLS
jgi:predicted SAM-dependent methyltransferase